MAFADLYDDRVPGRIRSLALERIRTKQSLETRIDIDEDDRILALQAIHSALPFYKLRRGELAMCEGISPRTARRRRRH